MINKKDITKQMSSNLRRLRDEKNLSQEDLCAKLQLNSLDISRSTYAKYECAINTIQIDVIVALKNFYNCDYSEFFEGVEINTEEEE